MANSSYQRLAGMDRFFLVSEDDAAHMHIAATIVLDAGPLLKPEGGIDIDRIRDYVASRLPSIPRYRQVLNYSPIEKHPLWVDDQHFNIHYHVRHTSLPRPGNDRQLKHLSARVMSQQLDRAKPLWELWVVEGLEGNRLALISKTHHCMVDGLSGVDLLAVLMSDDPNQQIEDVPAFDPKPAPSNFEMVRDELVRRADESLQMAKGLVRTAISPSRIQDEVIGRIRGLAETLNTGLQPSSRTPFNQKIGPHRRFDYVSMDLSDVRAVKEKLGGTVNDVVLATVTGAVRRFFEYREVELEELDFRVLAPVSVRSEDARGTLGNQISMWLLSLPVAEKDPRRRFELINRETSRLRETNQALGAQTLIQVTNWTGSTLLSLASQLLHRARPFNMVVTNVPGPQMPLYLQGARIRSCYPLVPLFANQALGVALFSYDGKLFWGFNGDYDLMPDMYLFADAIVASFNELREATLPGRVLRLGNAAKADPQP